jgi:hypothetical protein
MNLNEPTSHPSADAHSTSHSFESDLLSSAALPPRPTGFQETVQQYNSLSSPEQILAGALALNQLILERYGSQYTIEFGTNISETVDRITMGQDRLLIAFDKQGEPAAAAAVLGGTEGVYEVGALVRSVNRGSPGLGKYMAELATNEALHTLNAPLVVSHAVSAHLGSQKAFAALNYTPTGMTVLDWNDVFQIGQRDSSVTMALMARDPAPGRTLYVTDELAPILRFVGSGLGTQRSLDTTPPAPATTPDPSIIPVFRDYIEAWGSIYAYLPTGASATDCIQQIESHFASDPRLQYASVEVDITAPSAHTDLAALSQAGYFYANYATYPSGDSITMQRLAPGLTADPAKIKLISDAQILLDLVRDCSPQADRVFRG